MDIPMFCLLCDKLPPANDTVVLTQGRIRISHEVEQFAAENFIGIICGEHLRRPLAFRESRFSSDPPKLPLAQAP